MAKACCDTGREERLKQYSLNTWKIKDIKYKAFKTNDILYSPPCIQKKKDSG